MQQWLQILISNETALSCCHRFKETIPSFLLGENLILPFFIFLNLALLFRFLSLLYIKHYIHSLYFGQCWLDNRENNITYITVKGLLVPKFCNVYQDICLQHSSFNLWFFFDRKRSCCYAWKKIRFHSSSNFSKFGKGFRLFRCLIGLVCLLLFISLSLVFLSEMWFDLMICLLQKKTGNIFFLIGVLMEQVFVRILSEMT